MAEAAGYGCARGAGEDFEGWTRTSGRGADLHGINLIFATTPAETWVETGVSQAISNQPLDAERQSRMVEEGLEEARALGEWRRKHPGSTVSPFWGPGGSRNPTQPLDDRWFDGV